MEAMNFDCCHRKESGASANKKAPVLFSGSKLEIVAASWNMVSGDGTWCTTRHQQILADANRRYITPPDSTGLHQTPPDSTRLFRKENSLLCNIYTVDFEVCVKFWRGRVPPSLFSLTLINQTHYIMKKILFTLILLAALPLAMNANPARKVTLKYDAETEKLTVTILHPVRDTVKHYISEISILVDDKEIEKKELTGQSSADTEVYEITLPGLTKGSVIEVETKCNQFGRKKGKLTVK
jgi:desulfoferrodoxin (superoxide reductase-like protein)